jgi:hypothetical protein
MRINIFVLALGLLALPVSALNLGLQSRVPRLLHDVASETSKGRRNFLEIGVAATFFRPQCVLAQDGLSADPGSAFVGHYTDPKNHPGGIRDITLLDTKLGKPAKKSTSSN